MPIKNPITGLSKITQLCHNMRISSFSHTNGTLDNVFGVSEKKFASKATGRKLIDLRYLSSYNRFSIYYLLIVKLNFCYQLFFRFLFSIEKYESFAKKKEPLKHPY